MGNEFDPAAAKQKIRKLLAAAMHKTGITAALQRSAALPWRILTYHRITSPEVYSVPLQPGMYVRPKTFEMQIRYLKDHCRVVPLSSLVQSILEGREVEQRTVAITFDDGWHDNYENAFPMLREAELPATIFLATSFIGTREMFWTDRVAQTLASLRGAQQYREQILGRIREKFPPRATLRDTVEIMLSTGNETTSHLDNLLEELKRVPPNERKAVVNELYFLAKEFTTMKSERVFMNWDEVVEMSRFDFTFGSHTHHHHRLTELNEAQLRDELVESYQELRAHGLKPPPTFCYPGGYYNDLTQRALRSEKIPSALTTERHSVLDGEPPLLGRVHIHEDMTSTVPLFTARIWGPGR